MGTTTIDWKNVQVTNSSFTSNTRVENVIAKYERCMNVGRKKDPTYEIEWQFLNSAGIDKFTHRTYEMRVHPIPDPLYVQFTPTEIIVGTGITR